MWASELGVVVTSNNSQQRHGQLRWTQWKSSPIAMNGINAIIVRRWSAHEMSLSTVTRKAMAISLKTTRWPCQQMQQEHCERVVGIPTILIPQRQLLSRERQSPQRKHNGCKKDILYARNLRQVRQIHAPDLPQRTWNQQKSIQKRTHKQNKKNKAVVTRTPRVRCDDCWTSHKLSCLAEPVTPSLVTTEQVRATTTKTTILLVLNPKVKRMLVVRCSGLATATSSQVQSTKNILDGFSLQGCLDLKLDGQILLRRLVTSSSKTNVWFR